MKKKMMLAVLAGAAMLAATGCSAEQKETEAQTKAAVETEAATEAVEKASEAAAETVEAATELVSEAAEVLENVDEEMQTSAAEAVEELTEETTEAETELGERPDYTALDYVEVGEYKSLPVSVDEIVVTDADVDDAVAYYVENAGITEEVDGPIEEGDIANIDYEGKVDGVAFDGGTAQGYDLTIGSHTFIDGFEEGLVGVKAGETVDVNVTFPDPYQSEDLAGKDAVFTVKVNAVKRTPELSDDVAVKIATLAEQDFTTVDGLKDYVREQLTAYAQTNQDNIVMNELMTQLTNTCKVTSIPEELTNYSMAKMTQNYTRIAENYGMTLEDLVMQMMGMDMDTFNAQTAADIEKTLEQELLLTAIAEKENITVTDEEYKEKCERYAANAGVDVETFLSNYDEKEVRAVVLEEKVLEFVKDNAIITVKEPETEEEPIEAVTEGAEVVEALTEAVESATEGTTEK